MTLSDEQQKKVRDLLGQFQACKIRLADAYVQRVNLERKLDLFVAEAERCNANLQTLLVAIADAVGIESSKYKFNPDTLAFEPLT